jgi:thiol-disulfide isomerase/thioredoxin
MRAPAVGIGLLWLSVVGCASVPEASPRVPSGARTVTVVGDRPVKVAAGEPGASQSLSADPEPPMEPERRIAGRVIDEDGDPVPDAVIRLAVDGTGAGRSVEVTTDPAGRFGLSSLRSGSEYTLIAEWEDDRGDLRTGRRVVVAPESNVEIVLKPRRRAGRVGTASDRREVDDEGTAPGAPRLLDDAPALADEPPPAPAADELIAEGPLRDEARSAEPAPAPAPAPRRAEAAAAVSAGDAWRRSGSTRPAAGEPAAIGARDVAPLPAAPAEDDGANPLPPAREPAAGGLAEPTREPAAGAPTDLAGSGPAPPAFPPDRDERSNTTAPATAPIGPAVPAPAEPASGPSEALIDAALKGQGAPKAPAPAPPEPVPTPTPDTPTPDPEPITAAPSAPVIPDLAPKAVEPPAPVTPAPGPTEPAPALPDPKPEPEPQPEVPAPSPAPEPTPPAPIEGAEGESGKAPAPPAEPDAPPAIGEGDAGGPPPIAEPPSPIAEPPSPSPADPGVPTEPAPEGAGDAPKSAAAGAPPAARVTWGQLSAQVERQMRPSPALAGAAVERVSLESSARSPRRGASAASVPAAFTLATCRYDARKRRLEEFTLADVGGKAVRLGDLDADLVLLDFWGTWCGPCLRAIPELVGLQAEFGPRLKVVGIAYEQGEPAEWTGRIGRVADREGINYTLLMGEADGRPCPLRAALQVQAFPTLVLVDRDGQVLWRDQGATPANVRRLRRVIGAKLNLNLASQEGGDEATSTR